MNVFITGGTGGIGAALARYYLKYGHRVGVCGGDHDDFIRAFPDQPELVEFYLLDVTSRESCIQVIGEFAQGSLDILIAAAGVNDGSPVQGRPLDFDRSNLILDVNLRGALNSVEGALPMMQAQGFGSIAILSSAAGLNGFGQTPAYCASKAAVNMLCESLSLRYADQNISVSAIMPGYIDTPLARATHPDLEKMPFLMDSERAARKIARAIKRRKMRYVFPWQIRMVSRALQVMPRPFFRSQFKWSEK
ncbi:MAG: SDR family NAD(P)-dependent oxidoreductase [Thalassolituus maritimus]|nr:SDR family NAD(P)-dependent oxidoreductase [Pseudomonadota bacterium]MEE3159914.1 SDR family NAD(P)-dependent oxidoreductase [Pseudomonadota bacterium]TPD55195.1 MAG: SDR family NAD(P)-dependent oxidoreductase [Thalassolituus maritimus]HCG77833.1 hypothetical protein [Oceanospirillales bacterium]